jgi:hypothetical protein
MDAADDDLKQVADPYELSGAYILNIVHYCCLEAMALERPVLSHPPAIAPMTKKGSFPDATSSGRSASGGWCDRSSSQAKKRR